MEGQSWKTFEFCMIWWEKHSAGKLEDLSSSSHSDAPFLGLGLGFPL